MWLSTLEIRAVQLRSVTEIAPKSPFLCVNRSPVRNGFCASVKAIWYSVNIASDRLPDGRQNTLKHLENIPVIPDGWRHEACHAYHIFFTKSIVCVYLDSCWHLLQVCWRRKAFLARSGKEGSLAGKCICRNVHYMEFNYKQFVDVISSFTFTHIQQCST